MSETLNKALAALIRRQKRESFTNPSRSEDSDALGILVAHWAEWNAELIVQAFLSALEDSNFKTLHQEVSEAWRREIERTAGLLEEEEYDELR